MSEFRRTSEQIHLQGSLLRAVEAVTGDPHANPLEVFPNPADKERRADVEWGVELTEDQESAFRAAMAELGPGRENNKGLDITKLSNQSASLYDPEFKGGYEWKAVLEGGQIHKVGAELELVLKEPIAPAMIIPTGARDRKIGDKEKASAAKLLDIKPEEVGDTEYDIVRQWFEHHPDFEPFEEYYENEAQYGPGGYGIAPAFKGEDTGQFVSLGMIKDIPVILMRVDRFPDPSCPEEYPARYIQPNNAQKMSYAAALRAPNEFDVNIGFVTSATYQPSCEIEASRVVSEFKPRMTAQVLSYGTHELARIKGEEPVQPSIAQLGAEAYKTALLLERQK